MLQYAFKLYTTSIMLTTHKEQIYCIPGIFTDNKRLLVKGWLIPLVIKMIKDATFGSHATFETRKNVEFLKTIDETTKKRETSSK